MSDHMITKFTSVLKTCWTVPAVIWSIWCLCAHMHLKKNPLTEGLITLSTTPDIGFSIVVCEFHLEYTTMLSKTIETILLKIKQDGT